MCQSCAERRDRWAAQMRQIAQEGVANIVRGAVYTSLSAARAAWKAQHEPQDEAKGES